MIKDWRSQDAPIIVILALARMTNGDQSAASGLQGVACHKSVARHEQEHGIVSIGSIASATWTPPLLKQSGIGGATNIYPASASSAGTSVQAGSATAPGSPDQPLSADILAMLLQAQGDATMRPEAAGGSVATASPAAGTGQVQPHHGHHHHEGGFEDRGNTAVGAAGTAASSATAMPA
jgi:hypothetical protein